MMEGDYEEFERNRVWKSTHSFFPCSLSPPLLSRSPSLSEEKWKESESEIYSFIPLLSPKPDTSPSLRISWGEKHQPDQEDEGLPRHAQLVTHLDTHRWRSQMGCGKLCGSPSSTSGKSIKPAYQIHQLRLTSQGKHFLESFSTVLFLTNRFKNSKFISNLNLHDRFLLCWKFHVIPAV